GDAEDLTALHVSAREGQPSSLVYLLKAHADPSARSDSNTTPLHLASEYGHHDIVELLLEQSMEEIDEEDAPGRSAVYIACKSGHESIAKLLLEKGASLDASATADLSLLHYAVQMPQDDLATMLLQKGASPNRPVTLLAESAQRGSLPLVELLMRKGANINGEGNTWAPLHAAADGGHHEIVKLLLEHGAIIERHVND
ncbi:ankyrin, partial [Pleomassaria siparia CBS 279.74]